MLDKVVEDDDGGWMVLCRRRLKFEDRGKGECRQDNLPSRYFA